MLIMGSQEFLRFLLEQPIRSLEHQTPHAFRGFHLSVVRVCRHLARI